MRTRSSVTALLVGGGDSRMRTRSRVTTLLVGVDRLGDVA